MLFLNYCFAKFICNVPKICVHPKEMSPLLCFFLILKDENMRLKAFFYYLCHADNNNVVGLIGNINLIY